MSKKATQLTLTRRGLMKGLAGLTLAVGLGGALVTAGCDSAGGPAQTKDFTGKPDVDKARQEAKDGGISFYTSLDTAIVELINKPFRDKYGIDIKVYRAGGREVTSKVLAEADANAVQCDVLDASELAAFREMKRRNLFGKYVSAESEAIKDEHLKDKEGFWVANRLTQVVFGYNTNAFKGDDIARKWADLTNAKYMNKMCLQEPKAFTLRIYTTVREIGKVLGGEDKGWQWLTEVGKNKPRFVQSVQIMAQMTETGEIPLATWQNDNLILRSKDQGRPVDIAFPSEGVVTEPGAMSVMATTKKPNAAKLLLDWWISKEGQAQMVAGMKYSCRPDVAPPKGGKPLSELKLWFEDDEYVDKNRVDIEDKLSKALGAQ